MRADQQLGSVAAADRVAADDPGQLGAERRADPAGQAADRPADRPGRDAGGRATFPYSALLYEPDGTAAVYVPTGQLTFLRHFVKVAAIDGSTVVVTSGVTPGQSVVTAGAEELLGVQNGVGEET